METLTQIWWFVVDFFLTMTVAKWMYFTILSLVFEVACRYIWSFWSVFYELDFEDLKNIGQPDSMFIARQFLWPFTIPVYFFWTLRIFLAYKRYEIDDEKMKELEKQVEEYKKNSKEDSL